MLKCMVCHFAVASDAINATVEDDFQPQVKMSRVVARNTTTAANTQQQPAQFDALSMTEASFNGGRIHPQHGYATQ